VSNGAEQAASGIERVRFAVLKIGGGSLDRLWTAVKLAQSDWRDVVVVAGFGDDVPAHLRWLADALASLALRNKGIS
jgi:hypothetical protein